MKNKEYFKKIEKDYQEASEYNDELYRNIGSELDRILWGKVIDFGNGGVINYSTDDLEKVICVDIINQEQTLSSKKVDFIYGDFYAIDLNDKANCVLAQLMLHHLVDTEKIKHSLRHVHSLLEEGGRFIIVEVEFPRFLERIQNIFKPVLFKLLSMMNKPSLRFFSRQSLEKLVTEAGFSICTTRRISIGKRVSPAPVLFPKLKIPGKLYPFKCMLLETEITSQERQ